MSSVYINLYDRTSYVLELARTLIDNNFIIYSQGITFKFLVKNQIETTEIKTDESHPNIEIINIITGKKKSNILKPDLIISDLPSQDFDLYNTILIISAIKNEIPVLSQSSDIPKINSHLKLFGEISEELKKELISKALTKISYLLSYKSYEIFPYINTKNDLITIPLSKTITLNYGENPHQTSFIYSSPLKSDFKNIKVINGSLTLNHFLDIKKGMSLLKEINENTAVVIRHTNISFIKMDENKERIIKSILDHEYGTGKTYIFNFPITTEVIEIVKRLKPNSIIAPSFSTDFIEYIKKNNYDTVILSFTPNLISPPIEKEIIYLDGEFAIEDRDIVDELTNIKIEQIGQKHMKNPRDLKLSFIISKNLKTYNCALVCDGILLSYSQGEESGYSAGITALFKLTKKNMIKFKEEFVIAMAMDGSINASLMKELINFPVKTLICSYIEDEDEVRGIANKARVEILLTKKRHFRHI